MQSYLASMERIVFQLPFFRGELLNFRGVQGGPQPIINGFITPKKQCEMSPQLAIDFSAKKKKGVQKNPGCQRKYVTPRKINMEHNHGGLVQIIFLSKNRWWL